MSAPVSETAVVRRAPARSRGRRDAFLVTAVVWATARTPTPLLGGSCRLDLPTYPEADLVACSESLTWTDS